MIEIIFTTAYLRIKLKTNSPRIAALLDGAMSFGARPERGAAKLTFFITHEPRKDFGSSDYSYHRTLQEGVITTHLHHGCLAAASVDEKKMVVKGAVYGLHPTYYPRISQTLFIDPIIQLLSLRGCQFLHGALLEKGGNGILVSGPSGSGKSTLALALALRGCQVLTDDKCFFRFNPKGDFTFLAMRQSIGVQPQLWRKFSAIRRRPSKMDSDGQRRRIPGDSFLKERKDQFRLSPKAILFPSFEKGARARIKNLSAQDALKRLLADKSNVSNACRNKKSLSQALLGLHQLATRIPAYQVFYDDRGIKEVGKCLELLFQ